MCEGLKELKGEDMFSRDQKLSKLQLALEMQEQNKDMGVPQSWWGAGAPQVLVNSRSFPGS